MQKGELGEPVGAIWVKNWKLRDSIISFFKGQHQVCRGCGEEVSVEFDEAALQEALKAHTLAVKVKILKEKFIAIENTRKRVPTQPDYFLHVYQTHTGADPTYPFGVKE